MLRRLVLRDFVIVKALEVELDSGFTVLTGETGAGKSILIDALQLALGHRGDTGVIREGAQRAEISAEFDVPPRLLAWLEEAGLTGEEPRSVLLRRNLDAQGKSRAWINGSPVTLAQLKEAAEHLVDIHGQHAWQSLTRVAAVRALLDSYAGLELQPLSGAWTQWRTALSALEKARTQQDHIERERSQLQLHLDELEKLSPGPDEWTELNTEHRLLSNSQLLLESTHLALAALSGAEEASGDHAQGLTFKAQQALETVASYDSSLSGALETLQSAQAQLQDVSHTLLTFLSGVDLDPQRLETLDQRIAQWMSLARRWREPPAELSALMTRWQQQLDSLNAATDLDALEEAVSKTAHVYAKEAEKVSKARHEAAPRLSQAITSAMQTLGMTGGRFEVALTPLVEPQSFGAESVDFLVAGHAGSTPRPMAKVASGGELSRIALAVAVTTSQLGETGTLIFDEIDAGVGGAVADTVGQLMKRLGHDRQVMAVTHLPQVAAYGDHHFVVAKSVQDGVTLSDVRAVQGTTRISEIARMLGGEKVSQASLAHAKEMLKEATHES
jgi:DNA repair protein RecN (Recombination protein N)